MLKKFFISMLGTIAGLWIAITIFVFCCIIAVGALVGATEGKTQLEKHSILHICLDGDIPERAANQSVMEIIQNFDNKTQTLSDMITAIKLAAQDKKIDGIFIEAKGSAMGVASRQELLEALMQFKESKKWIYAYADTYTQGDYLIASVADKVFLNPVGNVDIRGIGTYTPFYTGLLDKLGIKVQVVKVGTYKSAVEPFTLTEMSEASRLQTQVFVDSIWDFYANAIARTREVAPTTVSQWADSLTFAWNANRDVDEKIVTETKYRREVEQTLRDLTEREDDEDLCFITPADYLASKSAKLPSANDRHIAVLYAVGDIVESGEGGIVGETMVPQITDLADDDNVCALVLRVNSGGGSAFASEQIWEALEYFKSKGKPFYVSMGDYAASGGYYISCGADSIFADPTTLTGSIGVFGMIPDISGLVTDKLGVSFSSVSSSPNANFMSITQPMTPLQRQAMQRYVEETYDLFTSRVAEGRHMSVDSVKAIAEGRVWVGASALGLGLVDKLGSLDAAIKSIAELVDVDAEDYVCYPDVKNDLMQRLLEETGNIKANGGMLLDSEAIKYFMTVKKLREMSPIQARMPEVVID